MQPCTLHYYCAIKNHVFSKYQIHKTLLHIQNRLHIVLNKYFKKNIYYFYFNFLFHLCHINLLCQLFTVGFIFLVAQGLLVLIFNTGVQLVIVTVFSSGVIVCMFPVARNPSFFLFLNNLVGLTLILLHGNDTPFLLLQTLGSFIYAFKICKLEKLHRNYDHRFIIDFPKKKIA